MYISGYPLLFIVSLYKILRVCWDEYSSTKIRITIHKYRKSHYIRHYLDVMHIEKNVCKSIVGTLLNDPNKIKDGKKTRLDLQELKIIIIIIFY